MNNAVKKSILKQLRPWAEIYDRMSLKPSEENMRKQGQACERLLSGRWLSHRTEAHEIWIKRKDGSKMRLLIVMKKDHKQGVHEKDTGFLWMHGGGYCIGVPEMDFMFTDLFCENDDVVMVLPDYRKALEAPYPSALDDCMLALEWMKEHAAVLGINEEQLFVGGESAGGGLACAVTLRARDEGKIPIAFSMPLYPMISEKDTASSKDNHMPVWNTAYNHLAWQLYKGNLKESTPYFSPSEEKNFTNLPPHFSIVSDIEPFYMETKQYFDHLYQAGVPVMLKEYTGCFHAFDMLAGNTDIAKKARDLERRVFHYAQKNFFTKEEKTRKKEDRPLSHEEKVLASLHDTINAQRKVLKQEEPEDVFSSLQKVIEDDTASSLKDIEDLISQLH